MANLRIISITINDSSSIYAKFSEALSENIGPGNISIISQTPGVPDVAVNTVNVVYDTLQIGTQPLTDSAAYFIIFSSVGSAPFKSLNGTSFIPNDSVSNKQLIIGPTPSDNPVNQYFNNFLINNVYEASDPSVISKYIQALSSVLSRNLSDIRQLKSDNYLSTTVLDESKTRSYGAFDRLNEAGAYEILRVGKDKTSAPLNNITSNQLFYTYPVSLLSEINSEQVIQSSLDNAIGTFNLNTLVITLSKSPLLLISSILFTYNSPVISYNYDITKYGYQIFDSKYDPNYAFTYVQLANNQIKLNEKILNDSLFSTENIIGIQISYKYKNLGKIVDNTTVSVDVVLSSGREAVPPIENVFTLQHAPIVDENDNIASIGSITFTDPNSLPSLNQAHPAFTAEVAFRLDYLPSKPGEYSVDYSTGTAYVYGADQLKNGTGAFPPVAIYSYRYVYKENIDYVYDSSASDIVALPNGSLVNSTANIYFSYDNVLVPNVDYKALNHIEVLNERIGNSLIALNAIKPTQFPITNVFKIFNETTGEIYKILRWTDNKIFFTSVIPPNIVSLNNERASFTYITNETLFVNSTTVASPSQNIYQMLLNNNNIISGSEDCIGSSFNTSISFSNANVFVQELYYDSNLTQAQNITRLQNNGSYLIDYANGIVFCMVSSAQGLSVGSVSYKHGYIAPLHPHVISVEDIYYQNNILDKKDKSFNYTSFKDGVIIPATFDVADESFALQGNSIPYQILSQQVGGFINASFIPGVKNNINFLRSVFEHEDLINNVEPLNFVNASTVSGRQNITINSLSFTEYHAVQFDGSNYFILANTDLLYKSSNITINMSVVRLSDSAQLWNNSGNIVIGKPFKIVLPGINSPAVSDAVVIIYSYTINSLSRIVVDYNKGEYYIDYSYLADEIIISYEYGDNVLDFRQSLTLSPGDNYYVSYKYGALRDGLLKNFGTLIDIPILNNLDVNLNRERYREALIAAMQSFTQGPTITSVKNIVETIVHTPPEIVESTFQNWSLGSSLLNPEAIKTTGSFNFMPVKYGNGIIVNTPGQSISFPVASNVKLEQGTFETWVIPQWSGIDNQSNVNVTVLKNNQPINLNQIFLGSAGKHPAQFNSDGSFDVNYKSIFFGKPDESRDGIFVYLAPDISGKFNRWYVDVLDGYADGYVVKNYKINIKTNGKVYDPKSSITPKPIYDSLTTGVNSILYAINGNINVNSGITFIADYQHYIFDFGNDLHKNRLSIFKDESGFINFKVLDVLGNSYVISSDVSAWKAGSLHHVAASWQLNTKNSMDELHLFIDGFEVPNILRYGDRVSPYLHEKYRTVNAEEVIGSIVRPIVGSNDLTTTAGSALITSSLNFSAYGILPGDIVYPEGVGFSNTGYVVLTVSGNNLTVAPNIPLTTTNTTYSINKTSLNLSTEIDLYPNIAVSLLHSAVNGTDLQTSNITNIVSSVSTNFTTLDIKSGYVIVISSPAGFAKYYTIVSVGGNSLTLSDIMPVNSAGATYRIYSNVEQEIPGVRALRPAYTISRNTSGQVSLILKNSVLINDIVLIRTLGINNKRIIQKYYVWGNNSNIIKTQLPRPALLEDVSITHTLLDGAIVGPSTGGTLIGAFFTSGPIFTDQPSVSNGRKLLIKFTGSNINYGFPNLVQITGTVNNVANVTETLSFTATTGTTLTTTNYFQSINQNGAGVVITCDVINTSKDVGTIYIKELDPITASEDGYTAPIIRYSYQTLTSTTLSGSGSTITDPNAYFSSSLVGNYLVITSPALVTGQYQIVSVSADHSSATIQGSFASSFSNGKYQVLNTTAFSSGLQDGFITLEDGYTYGNPYPLKQGTYEISYYSPLSIPISSTSSRAYIGTDIYGNNILNGSIDEVRILSEKLNDTRIGEMVANNVDTITKDFNTLKQFSSNISTLVLLHCKSLPLINETDTYVSAYNKFLQSSISVNDNFNKSIYITDTPVVIDNAGILDNKKESTIEFWVSPLFDTSNDPNVRYYFDASSSVIENVISTNNATVKLSGSASKILNVKAAVGDQGVDYFAGGSISSDGHTLFLNKQLPNQQTGVVINYIPNGTYGDRVSIYKDGAGYINFYIKANNLEYVIRDPIFWTRGTWHRVKASYRANSGIGSDALIFFVDGYERASISLGNNLIIGNGQVIGSTFAGPNGLNPLISFKDSINNLYIGSDYTKNNTAYALIDNLRISDIFRPVFKPFGENIDVNYIPNTDAVYPVLEDLYTTLLLDFENIIFKNTNFTTIKNRKTGLFDISITIFDSFDIVNSNPLVKQILETLLDTLKPANSRLFLKYQEPISSA